LLTTEENIDLTREQNLLLLQAIFAAKEVPVDLLNDVAAEYERSRLDWPSVKDSVSRPLLEFDLYFEFALNRIGEILKALGVV
jgi:hypothetical protein